MGGTETFSAQFVGDNGPMNEGAYGDDDNFWQFRNILFFQASTSNFDTGIRLDSIIFHHPPSAMSAEEFSWGDGASGYTTLNYRNDFRVERVHGGFEVGRLSVTLGDFYATFGKGIVLSLTKVDDVGLDTGLLGARVAYKIKDTLEVTLLGGVVNALNEDPVTHQVLEDDPLDRIGGARIEWRVSKELTLAGHGVLLVPRYTDEGQIPDHRLYVDRGPGVAARSVGGSVELNFSTTMLFAEADYQRHDDHRPPEGLDDVIDETGYALFAQVRQLIGTHEVTLEGYFYSKWLMEGPYRGSAPNIALSQPIPYQKMVTMELPWMPVKSLGNAIAGRLSWLRYLEKSGTELKAKVLLVSNRGGLTPQGEWIDHDGINAIHPTLHFDQSLGQTGLHLLAQGGYRYEWADVPDHGDLWHLSTELTVPVTETHSIVAHGGLRRHRLELTESGDPYWVATASLGYDASAVITATVLYEYSDQVEGTQAGFGTWDLPVSNPHYLSIICSYYLPEPLEGMSLGLRVGSQRGGYKCAGGVCREFPDSVGAKMEATYRF